MLKKLARASLVIALAMMAAASLRAADVVTPSDTLTIEGTDELTMNVWSDKYGVQSQEDEFSGPTYFNAFIDPNDETTDVVYSGIFNYADYSSIPLNTFTLTSNNPLGNGIDTFVGTQNLQIEQTILYNSGDSFLEQTWRVTNLAGTTNPGALLRFGGVTNLNNWYVGIGLATPPNLLFGTAGNQQPYPSMAYIIQPGNQGYFGLYADPGDSSTTAFSNYQEDVPGNVISNLGEPVTAFPSGVLANTVNSDNNYNFAALALEWGLVPITSDNTVAVSSWETWGSSSQVNVSTSTFPSNPIVAGVGNAVPVTFTVNDQAGNGGTYYLIAQSTTSQSQAALLIDSYASSNPAGLAQPGGPPVLTLGAGESVTITLMVEGNPSALPMSNSALLSLLALSTLAPNVGQQANAPITLTTGPAVQVTPQDATLSAMSNVPIRVTFSVYNGEPTDDQFAFVGSGPEGVQIISAPGATTIGADSTVEVSMEVSDGGSLGGQTGFPITLTATSTTVPGYTASATTDLSFTNSAAFNYTVQAADAAIAGVTGAKYQETFTVTNTDPEVQETLDFQILATPTVPSPGLVVETSQPFSITLPARQSAQIFVTVHGEAGLTSASLSLIASSEGGTDSASAAVPFTFTPPTLVTGPATQATLAQTVASATFMVTNQGTVDDSFSLSIGNDPNLTILSAPTALAVPAGTSAPVAVTFLASAAATLTLTATSQANPSDYFGSASDAITLTLANTSTLVVTAPAPVTEALGTTAVLTFTVTNNADASDTFDLRLQSTPNLPIQTPSGTLSPVTLGAGASQNLVVTLFSQSGTSGAVSLTATSESAPATTASGTTLFTLTPAIITTQPVVVTPPAAAPATAGSPVLLTFVVTNNELAADTFNLQLVVPAGISVTSVQQPLIQAARVSTLRSATPTLQPVALPPGGSATILVTVVASPSGAAASDDVQLVATSQSNQTFTSTASVTLTVPATPTTPQPGAAVTVVSPTVAVSTNGNTVYGSISPGTPQAVGRLLSTLSSLGANQAVAYAWDATTQAFVQLPIQPSGGLLPSSGVFIASAVSVSFDLSGSSTQSPSPIVLQPGWNFIGIPPVDPGNGAAVLTTHAFPRDFDLLDGTGTLVATAATFANTLGTVGSSDATTAEPYLFDGVSYSQQATLISGVGYWIKNNSTQAVTLQRVLSGITLSAVHSRQTQASSSETYTDRGTPPSPPAASASHDASSGGHCGSASGSAVLLMTLGLLALRRRRSI